MVGRPPPAARLAYHLDAFQAAGEVWCHPDVVEAATAVGGLPIGGAVAPPGEQLLLDRHQMADRVDPAADAADRLQSIGLDRGVADDAEELLVRPDIGLVGRNVEVADQDRLAIGLL